MSGIEPDVDSSSLSETSSYSNAEEETETSPKQTTAAGQNDMEGVDALHPILSKKERWGWYLYDGANSVFARYVRQKNIIATQNIV
jgi:hypothetical protein